MRTASSSAKDGHLKWGGDSFKSQGMVTERVEWFSFWKFTGT